MIEMLRTADGGELMRRLLGGILQAVVDADVPTEGPAGAAPQPNYDAQVTRVWPGVGVTLNPPASGTVPGIAHAEVLAAAARFEPGARSLTGKGATATLGVFTDTAYAPASDPDQPILKNRLVWLVETPDSPISLGTVSSDTPGCPRLQVIDAFSGDQLMGFRSCTVRIPDPAVTGP